MSEKVDHLERLISRLVSRLGQNNTSYLFGFLAVTCFFISNQSIKTLKIPFELAQLTRGLVTVFMFSYLNKLNGYDISLEQYKEESRWLIFRNWLNQSQQMINFYLIAFLPLSIVAIIQNLGPICIMLLNYLMYQKKMTKREMGYSALCFFGVVLVSSSNQITCLFIESESCEYGQVDYFYLGITFLNQLLWGYTYAIIHKIKKTPTLVLNFNQGIMGIILAGIFIVKNGKEFTLLELLKYSLASGIPISIAQFFFMNGYRMASNGGKFTLMHYIFVFYSYIFSIIYDGIEPGAPEIIGILLVLYCLYKILIKN